LVQHSAKEALLILKENGFHEISGRVRGDHHRFTDYKGHFVTVAFSNKKSIIPPKTFGEILKQAGLK